VGCQAPRHNPWDGSRGGALQIAAGERSRSSYQEVLQEITRKPWKVAELLTA